MRSRVPAQLVRCVSAESNLVKSSAQNIQKVVNDLEGGIAKLRQLIQLQLSGGLNGAAAARDNFWDYLQFYRSQASILGTMEFTNPAWNLLLEIYSNGLLQRRVFLTDTANAAGVPMATALRWYTKLEKDGWLVRHADTKDRRKSWYELSPEGIAKFEAYFARFAAAGAVRGRE